ncbi:MAG TPA: PQQ-dependent catabolism-associated CXXCW motif protein [Terriglobia bacterium]|nr:PQQ-dependent catabolism-associated CXXCW motif protein [Terriglobia bacterium]
MMSIRLLASRWLLLLGLMAMSAAAFATDSVPEPADYRLSDYRGPTPSTLKGATTIAAGALHQLMQTKPVLVIDVLPQPPRPANLPATTLWRPPTRLDIPGSIWLANTGYGQLAAEIENYFRNGLERLTLGDKDRALVFYCEAECWMSWNAAKRAISYGYRHVYWFAGGMRDWEAAGYPALPNLPIPLK